METKTQLDYDAIIRTIVRLEKRIADRFPDSGLRKITLEFLAISQQSKKNIDFIDRPNLPLRIFTCLVIVVGVTVIIYSLTLIQFDLHTLTFSAVVALAESTINDMVLLGAAIFFLVTLENRVKRTRSIKFLNELRAVAHVIDMHQLTKDPILIADRRKNTPNSPIRSYSKFELSRYLDYCTELLSLVGKVAALYSQSMPDDNVHSSVNDIEVLSSGISQKIWQKLFILNMQNEELLPGSS